MNSSKLKKPKIRFHLTNITGLGASKLLESLLPYLESDQQYKLHELYLPSLGPLSNYEPTKSCTKVSIYNRILPNLFSRFIECLFTTSKYNDGAPMIVFGDVPLRIYNSNQIVFLHSSLIVTPWIKTKRLSTLKYVISRVIFKINLPYIKYIVVQTPVMEEKLLSIFPSLKEKIHIIPQPVPAWVKKDKHKKNQRIYTSDSELTLIYPAANYPHKNHKILKKIEGDPIDWPISKLILTINENINPAPNIKWIDCLGELSHENLLKKYLDSDALLFLSLEESFGFPLIEAMHLDLPIICPDLPFAKIICDDQAVYFNPDDVNSLKSAVSELKEKLFNGWQPNWNKQLNKIPKDWKFVADSLIKLTN